MQSSSGNAFGRSTRGAPLPPSAAITPPSSGSIVSAAACLRHARHDVAVGVHGHRDRGVAQRLADDLRMHSTLEQPGGVGIAQIVEPDVAERSARPARSKDEPSRRGVRVRLRDRSIGVASLAEGQARDGRKLQLGRVRQLRHGRAGCGLRRERQVTRRGRESR